MGKKTVLYQEHLKAGARMVDFAGWEMPVQYRGILIEHEHTRKHVSLFDICHMGEFRVTGDGAAAALDAVFARPVADQKAGVCRYNFLLDDAGNVMDDLIVYCISDREFFIVVNASRHESDAALIRGLLPKNIVFADESDATAKLDLQGPESAKVLAACGLDAGTLPAYFHFGFASVDGIDCLLSRTGYTGELGFELFLKTGQAVELWERLLKHGAVQPAGLGARDTLRVEMGYALYGHELSDRVTPFEAGYGPMLKLEAHPERVFHGSAALRNHRAVQTLAGIRLEGRRAARAGCEILDGENRVIGQVTSGTFGPSLGCAIAMGYIETDARPADGKVLLNTDRVMLEGKLCTLPFYREGTAKAL